MKQWSISFIQIGKAKKTNLMHTHSVQEFYSVRSCICPLHGQHQNCVKQNRTSKLSSSKTEETSYYS